MSIDPGSYTRQDIFDAELTRLFGARMYVGSVHDLSEADSYIAMTLGTNPITVRRTTEGIRAFDNVCLHRCALIDPEGVGKRPFRCRYHAWAYAPDGQVRATPLVDDPCLTQTQLRQHPVAMSGDHVFIGLNGAAPDVLEVTHGLQQCGIPESNPAPFHQGQLLQQCNWKLLVENNIESYHLSFVHARSFIPAGFVSKSDYAWEHKSYTCWSRCTPTQATTKLPAIQRISRDATHDFRHTFVFPNLFLTATNGLVGFRSHVIPLGPALSSFKWELFELPALLALAAPIREQIRQEAIRFTETSLQEDKPMVEACQLGFASPRAKLQLQPQDARIHRFHQHYSEQMAHVER